MTWPLPFYGFDWQFTFYHAARMLLTGHNPYLVPTFNNPPWALLPLIPFALFPESIGTTLYFVFSVLVYAFVAHKLQAKPVAFIAFMLSTPVLYGLYRLNIDALVLVGFVLPAPIGLFFVLMKPQMGFAMAVYWLVQAWKTGGIKKVALTFAPVVTIFGLSFLFFGNWITNRQPDLAAAIWNTSLWPWSIPIGLVLLAVALRDMRQDFAMAASPFMSPYVAYYSWVGVLAGFLGDEYILIVAVVGMWVAQIILFWH
jgi:hypothetical protein